jgi:Ca2+-binding RTX toxin-like protein
VTAGDGNDTVWGQAGDDMISGNGGNDTLAGNQGNDSIDGGDGVDTIYGDDNIYSSIGDGNDHLSGGAGNDSIYGGGGNDSIYGGGGNDSIYGGGGNDTIDGGADNDYLIGGRGSDHIDGGDGNDNIDGQGDYGNGPDDNLGDVLNRGAGDDMITGGFGDTVDGGTGTDRLYFSGFGATAGVTADFSILTSGGTIAIGGATLSGIEYVVGISGTDYNDSIVAGAVPGVDGVSISDWGGDDNLTGSSGTDSTEATAMTSSMAASDTIRQSTPRRIDCMARQATTLSTAGRTERLCRAEPGMIPSTAAARTTSWWAKRATTRFTGRR